LWSLPLPRQTRRALLARQPQLREGAGAEALSDALDF